MMKTLLTSLALSALVILVNCQKKNPITYDEKVNNAAPLRLFRPFDKQDDVPSRVKRIVEKAFLAAENRLQYDSLPTGRYDTAFDAVMRNLNPLKNKLHMIDIMANSYMCGFSEITKKHQGIISQINYNVDHMHTLFLRFTGAKRKSLTIEDEFENTSRKAKDVCEWLVNFPVRSVSLSNLMQNAFNFDGGEDWYNKIRSDFQSYSEADYAKMTCDLRRPATTYMYGLYLRLTTATWKYFIIHYVHDQFVKKYASVDELCKTSSEKDEILDFGDWRKMSTYYAESFALDLNNKLNPVPDEIFACDPTELIRDETFIELEGAYQIVVLPPTYKPRKFCGANTNLYLNAYGFYNGYCDDDWSCSVLARPCLGHIYNCRSAVEYGDSTVTSCVLESGPRRYRFIEYYNGPKIEHKEENCKDGVLEIVSDKGTATGVCLCTCNDNHVDSLSTHVVNLMPVESDYKNNKVITGVKFIVVNRVLHLQIQQGPLNENLMIFDSDWKPVDDISDRVRNSRLSPNLPELKANQDYLILNNNHRFDLEDLNVARGEVLTGIRFTQIRDHLKLNITARTFDPTSGKICQTCPPKYYYNSKPNTQYHALNAEVPLSPPIAFQTIRKNNLYVAFTPSYAWTDFGQTTVPFFDAQPVVTEPPIPLSGIETTLKITPRELGIISLRLRSLKYQSFP